MLPSSLLKISIAQIKVNRLSPKENLEKGWAYMKEAANQGSDLIVFPEMWTSGFNYDNPTLHTEMLAQIALYAKEVKLWVVGSTLYLKENLRLANRATLISPEGRLVASYDKTHLFSPMNEDKHVERGNSITIYDAPWGKTGFSICYDIRFPELYRAYAHKGVLLIFCPIAFPHPRLSHWKVLSQARAIENQIYLISANQVGQDRDLTYFGSSAIIDPQGNIILEGSDTDEMLLSAVIDINHVQQTRQQLFYLQDSLFRMPTEYSSLSKPVLNL